MKKIIIGILIVILGIIGGVWYMLRVRGGQVVTPIVQVNRSTATPILGIQWKFIPATQTQEEIDSFG